MKRDTFRRWILDWWLSASVRRKLLLFIGVVSFMVLVVTLFSVGMVSLYLRDFNVVLGDSYEVNAAIDSFEKESKAFAAYAKYDTPERKRDYESAVVLAAQDIANLHYSYTEMELHRYLLTRAVRVSHESYLAECRRLLRMQPDNETYITQYYYVLRIGEYLDSYLKNLLQMTIAQGTEVYYDKVRTFQILPGIALFLGAVVILFAAALGTISIRHILNPLLRLAGEARELSAGTFDSPDLEVPNRDEIGELVHTFNGMKHSMARAITMLEEKSEMESLLHQEEVQRISAERALKTTQMSLLQSQINPHFLFNTLNTISRMARIEGAQNTEELIQRLAHLFRYNLQTASERVSLTRELNIINDYIYIQHRRFGNRIGFELDCRVDADHVMIPTFTLQPLVENAVIHGVSPKVEGGRIGVKVRPRGEMLAITVTDTGQGMPPEKLNMLMNEDSAHKGHLSGIGVGNVRARAEMLYPGSSFKIYSRVGLGTSIRILLPLQRDTDENKAGD